MNWETLGNLGSFLEGVVGVLTLWAVFYVLKQTRQMQEQNQLAARANLASVYQNVTLVLQRDFVKGHPSA